MFERKQRTDLTQEEPGSDVYQNITIEIQNSSESVNRFEVSILDINDSGMGITCDTQLHVGQVVTFPETQLDWELPDKGLVMWIFKASDGFRAGIKFI